MRWEATKALGRLWRFPALAKLGDADTQTRRNAARTLNRLSDPRAVEPLMAALRDQASIVRDCAALALGGLGEVAIDPLVSLLSYKDREIRRSVGRALANIDDDRVVDILAIALQDNKWWVRETVAECLVKLGDRAVPTLEAAVQSDNSDVRQLAQVTLRRIGTVRSQTALRFGSGGYIDRQRDIKH